MFTRDVWAARRVSAVIESRNGNVEGIVNHEILGLHHVREGAGHQTAYDVGFLFFGALLVLGGWLLARVGERDIATPS